MNNIEYIDEEVKEEIFEGTYILDGQSLTEKQQREKIFDLMRQAGLDVSDESKLEIGYEGADDDYGISDTQSTKFVVTRKVIKKVPYRVSREAVFEGTFILDGLRLTEEQQREKIFDLMKQAGLDISKEEFDTLEIGYEGADDDYGISDTQSTKFVVSKVIKTRLDENEAVNSREDYENLLKEIKRLREKLDTIVNDVSKTDIIQELMDKTEGLEKILSSDNKTSSNVYTEAIKEIDEQLKEIEKKLKEAIKSYEESYEKMRRLLSEQNEKIESSDLLTDEEYNEIMREFLGKKIEENEKTIAIRKEIEARKKQIAILKRKKNKIKKDLLQAESLGISPSQYQNITNTLMKRKIVNAILQTKGLNEIIEIPYKERTKEQNKKLKEAKEEIISEIAKLQKSQENVSVLDAIEALYGIDTEMVMKGKAREYKLTKKELNNVKDNVSLLPEKIVVRDKKLLNNNVLNSVNPTSAPQDMIEIYDKKVKEAQEKVEEIKNNDLEEKTEDQVTEKSVDNITLYVDEDNSDVYGNGYVFDRFHIKKQSDEKLIDGESCYKMDEEDADYIIENKDNKYAPYTVETKTVKIDKEQERVEKTENKDPIEKITIYIDTDNNNEVYANRYLFGRFNVDMLGNEIRIDGKACFRMSEEDATFILGNQDNSYSPYMVETREIQLGKREEKERIEQPIEKITIYIDTDNNNEFYGSRYLFSRFNMDTLSNDIRIDGKVCFRMSEEDATFILGNQDNNYSPYKVEIREVQLGKREFNNKQKVKIQDENRNEVEVKEQDDNINEVEFKEKFNNTNLDTPVERITLFKNNNGDVYGRKYLFDRFNIDEASDSVKIDGAVCFRINPEDLDFIVGNQDNNYSPYVIETEEVNLETEEVNNNQNIKEQDEDRNEVEVKENLSNTNLDTPVERITLYKGKNGEIYGRKYLFDRFNMDETSDPVKIDGAVCFRMSEDDATFILNNQNNNYSPYVIEAREANLDNTVVEAPQEVVEDNSDDTDEDVAEVLDDEEAHDESDHDEHLVDDSNDEENSKDDVHDESEVENLSDEDSTPEVMDREEEIPENNKKVRPHVETILDNLTKGLDIEAKDCPRYMASNIHVSEDFSRELHTGNVAYNVVHVVPGTLKAGIGLVKKLSSKLLLSSRGKKAMLELVERLNNLSEEELEVLFDEYKGSQLKTDMNNQINPIILDRLRRYGLDKVALLNDNIKDNYSRLFVLLGEIKVLEEKISNGQMDSPEVQSLIDERNKLLQEASVNVLNIKNDRKKANDLLSSGVHGLEEDFKAVASKLNYVGFRFAKSNAFDNELQHQLGKYGQELNIAIANNDYEGIVRNFMGLESLYYENTEIRGNALTRRSVGSKYYTPLAEQFNYNDDPFVRDLLSTVAVTSATVSAINAIRVHEIESAQFNDSVRQANAQNKATIDYVHNVGDTINSRVDTFKDGMEAQARGNVLTTSNVVERAELDMNNWSFTDAYHMADKSGHAFYNQFSHNVTDEINGVASRYSSGAINQMQALKEMTNIANASQQTLVDVSSQCLGILRNYAANHPNFDLGAVEESMAYIVSHPDAIVNMNNSVVDVASLGESLKGLTLDQYNGLVSIPSDMLSTLICAASAASLAGHVSNKMHKSYANRVTYGNDITDMMDDYLYSDSEDYDDELDMPRRRGR